MSKIVLDTCIFVSSLITKNTPPDMLYNGWRNKKFSLISSCRQLDEMKRVFKYKKLKRFTQNYAGDLVLDTISRYGTILEEIPEVNYSPDPNDNHIIATAIKGKADYIVSGDKKDLLFLKSIDNINIINARKCVEILNL